VSVQVGESSDEDTDEGGHVVRAILVGNIAASTIWRGFDFKSLINLAGLTNKIYFSWLCRVTRNPGYLEVRPFFL